MIMPQPMIMKRQNKKSKKRTVLPKLKKKTVLPMKTMHHYPTPLAETNHLLDQLKQLRVMTRKQR